MLFLALCIIVCVQMRAADGDTFTANTQEGIVMTFKIISEIDKTVQVGKGSYASSISTSTSGAVTIPQQIEKSGVQYTVVSIGYHAFYNCEKLTSVTIPNSVKSIGEEAFNFCYGLTSVNIPNSVTDIGKDAFRDCTGLTSLTIPNAVTSIGGQAFSGCSGLTSVTIPNSVTSIGYSAFYNCSGLTSVTIPNSVTSIGGQAFYGTAWFNDQPNGLVYAGNVAYKYKGTMPSNTTITLKDGTASITESAFQGCSGLKSVTISSSVTTIGQNAFLDCSGLTSVAIPNSVTRIDHGVFGGCSGLTSVTIPRSVTSIGSYAFFNCSGLASFTIPNSVTRIDVHAFDGCGSLTSVISEIEVPFAFSLYAFDNIGTAKLTVPRGTKDAYIAAGWTEDVFKGGIIEAPYNPASKNKLTIADAEVCKGRQIILPVNMNNTENITALQFDLTLPAGVSIAKNTQGKYIVEKTERCAEHTLNVSKPGDANVYKVLLYIVPVENITGSEGAVLDLTLETSDEMTEGEYDVTISNINLTTSDETKITPADVTCKLTVHNSIPGDSNGDGSIDVTDIVSIANGILGRASSSFDAVAADVNGDGSIDVTDIVVVANMILRGSGQNNAKMRGGDEEDEEEMLDPQ